jgi:hypothetical protein
MDMPKGWMDYVVEIPLKRQYPLASFEEPSTMPEIPKRRFRFEGEGDEIGRPIYKEIEE